MSIVLMKGRVVCLVPAFFMYCLVCLTRVYINLIRRQEICESLMLNLILLHFDKWIFHDTLKNTEFNYTHAFVSLILYKKVICYENHIVYIQSNLIFSQC